MSKSMPKEKSKNELKDAKAKLNLLPERLDAAHFADKRKRLVGQIKTQNMHRLQHSVVSMPALVDVELHFTRGVYGYPKLSGNINHSLVLRCERCLDDLNLIIDRSIDITLKPEAETLPDGITAMTSLQAEGGKQANIEAQQNIEYYDYDGKILMLTELLEEELLLALPLIPKHKDISLCNQDMIAWLAANDVPEQKRPSPFAILKR